MAPGSIDNILEHYHEEGYVILRGLFESEYINAVQRACESFVDDIARDLVAEGKADDLHEDKPFATRLMALYEQGGSPHPTMFFRDLYQPEFFNIFSHAQLLHIVGGITGSEIGLYPSFSVRAPLPVTGNCPIHWHQDINYNPREGTPFRMVNVWMPLVPSNRLNGCLHIIPGTHHKGVVDHGLFLLKIQKEEIAPVIDHAIPVEIDPGDVVILSNHLFHCGLPNRSDHIRWSLDFRYHDATQVEIGTDRGHLMRSADRHAHVVGDEAEWAQLQAI